MKKTLLVVLAMIGIADPAFSGTGRYAVIFNKSAEDPAGTFNRLCDRTANGTRAMRDAGMQFDVIAAADTGFYGALSTDDSVWFRQRYDAVIIFSQGALSSTATNPSNKINLGFRTGGRGNAIMAAGNNAAGPYSGNWGIPVFVWAFDIVDNGTVNFTCGITTTAINPNTSSKMQMTTASCPTIDGTTGDTIFVNSRMNIRNLSDANVTVLCGSVNGKSIKPAAAADTITYWRWRPGTKPGVYYFTVREGQPLSNTPPNVQGVAEAWILGQVCQVTGYKPPRPFVGWFDMDHVHANKGTVTDAGRAGVYNARDLQALADSLRSWKWVMAGPIFCGASLGNATLDSDNGGNGWVQPEVKQVIKDNEDMWSFAVHDHFDEATNVWRSSAQDTASICRVNYNNTLANATSDMWKNLKPINSAGSFGFHQTMPQDDGDWRAVKVFADAGVRDLRVQGGAGYTDASATATVKLGIPWIPAFGYPITVRSQGTDQKVIYMSGLVSCIPSTTRAMFQLIGTDYSTPHIDWFDKEFSSWLLRGAAYFHGNENFQGYSAIPTDYAPPLFFLKATKNMLKLTAPFVVPCNRVTAAFKGMSATAGE